MNSDNQEPDRKYEPRWQRNLRLAIAAENARQSRANVPDAHPALQAPVHPLPIPSMLVTRTIPRRPNPYQPYPVARVPCAPAHTLPAPSNSVTRITHGRCCSSRRYPAVPAPSEPRREITSSHNGVPLRSRTSYAQQAQGSPPAVQPTSTVFSRIRAWLLELPPIPSAKPNRPMNRHERENQRVNVVSRLSDGRQQLDHGGHSYDGHRVDELRCAMCGKKCRKDGSKRCECTTREPTRRVNRQNHHRGPGAPDGRWTGL